MPLQMSIDFPRWVFIKEFINHVSFETKYKISNEAPKILHKRPVVYWNMQFSTWVILKEAISCYV